MVAPKLNLPGSQIPGDNTKFDRVGFPGPGHVRLFSFPRKASFPDCRMNPRVLRTQYSLLWSICLCAMCATMALGQDGKSGKSTSEKKRLTPEERQQKNLAQQKIDREAQEKRWATFGVIPEDDKSPLADGYRKAAEVFRISTAEFADSQIRLDLLKKDADVATLRLGWLDKLRNSQEKLVAFRNAAADLVLSDPVRYENVALMLREMMTSEVANDRSDHWSHGARAVLSCENLVTDEVLLHAGYAGYIDSDWELATLSWTKLLDRGILPQVEQFLLTQLPAIRANWEKELELRKEDEAKNNPRVEIVTTKGIIEVELFEDDAPESVANFIYLVENKYYEKKPFYLVKQHLLAQTGCEKGDGKGTAGYSIRFEGDAPTARRHFRGSLAIPVGIDAETGKLNLDSGGSQFYIAFSPLLFVDGKHTVFGRIVRNVEFLGLLRQIDMTDEQERKKSESTPDSIVTAKVLRKRDHEYRPTPALGKLPR